MNEQEKYEWMVYVSCMTYNQASYIEDAMNGFTMQETNFPFVCAIVDDASTDGEQKIIKSYLNEHFDLQDKKFFLQKETDDFVLTFVRHKTNLNCFFAVLFLKYNHYKKKSKAPYLAQWRDNAKYIAMCEGDDYWISPDKLQKQVDFMESHSQHSLCFCAHNELLPKGVMKVIQRYDANLEQCPIEDLILGGGGYMATNSMLYRISMYVSYTTWAPGCPIGDAPLMLTLAHRGKVGYLADVMCVYRRRAVGAWSVRMISSKKLRQSHYRAIIKMWYQFDDWSGKQYHHVVEDRIRNFKRSYIQNEMILLFRKLFFMK